MTDAVEHEPDSKPTSALLVTSIDAYRRELLSSAAHNGDAVALQTLEIAFADGDVLICAADGTFLACEETLQEARHEAAFVLSAYVNGAHWAQQEIPGYRGHLQRYLPKIAAHHGVGP